MGRNRRQKSIRYYGLKSKQMAPIRKMFRWCLQDFTVKKVVLGTKKE